jgi:hypothetical protein
MTEITQADRDAAASGYFAWCSGNPVIPDRMKAGNADDHSMIQAFARHREQAAAEERAKIVAWLRETIFNCTFENIPDAIEAKEHLK